MSATQRLGHLLVDQVGEAVSKIAGKGARKAMATAGPLINAVSKPRPLELDAIEDGARLGTVELGTAIRDIFQRGVYQAKSRFSELAEKYGDTEFMPAFVQKHEQLSDTAAEIARPWLQKIDEMEQMLPEEKTPGIISRVLEGRAWAPDDTHAGIASSAEEIFKWFAKGAQDRGLRVTNTNLEMRYMKMYMSQGKDELVARRMARKKASKVFEPLQYYWPRYFSAGTILKYKLPGKLRDDTLKRIQKRFGVGRRESLRYLNSMLIAPTEFRGGVLQHSRTMDLDGYERDLYSVLRRYVVLGSKRLAEADVFGPQDQVMYNEIMPGIKMIYGSGVEKEVDTIFKATVGEHDRRFAGLIRPLTTIHAMTMLSTAGLLQPSQLLNLIKVSGTENTFRALGTVLRDIKWNKGWWHGMQIKPGTETSLVAQSGVLMHSILDDMGPISNMRGLTAFHGRVIGLEFMDNLNRLVSAFAGRASAQVWGQDLLRGSGAVRRIAQTRLTQAGISVDDVIKRGGVLTEEELRQAGRWVSRYTQFGNRPIDMPELRSHPLGPLFYLFRSYAIQQAGFLKREMDLAVNTGDYRSLIEFMAASAMTAPAIGSLVNFVRQKPVDPNERPDQTYMRQLLTAGVGGAYWDIVRASLHGPESLAMWAVGPTGTEVFTFLGSDIPSLVGYTDETSVLPDKAPDPKPLLKHLTRRIPIFGPTFYNLWWARRYDDEGKD